MTLLAQLGAGCAVVGLFLIIYGFPISGVVVTGAALVAGGVVLVFGLIAWEKHSDSAVKSERNDS
jgi:hypothetical protein